jgi:hypothetical protein
MLMTPNCRRSRVVVDVELGHPQLPRQLGRDRLHHGRDHVAGPAPFGPEIDQDRQVRSQHLPVEVLIGHGDDVGAH